MLFYGGVVSFLGILEHQESKQAHTDHVCLNPQFPNTPKHVLNVLWPGPHLRKGLRNIRDLTVKYAFFNVWGLSQHRQTGHGNIRNLPVSYVVLWGVVSFLGILGHQESKQAHTDHICWTLNFLILPHVFSMFCGAAHTFEKTLET